MTTDATWLITCRQWGAALAKITDLRIEVEEIRAQRDAARDIAAHLEAESAALLDVVKAARAGAAFVGYESVGAKELADALYAALKALDAVTP